MQSTGTLTKQGGDMGSGCPLDLSVNALPLLRISK